ncbi:MAG: divalent metal cation transporter [Deltaproteobacteria bacterium]|nr:divalent metal cation transporter [Deltaproteobacteria bacterium]
MARRGARLTRAGNRLRRAEHEAADAARSAVPALITGGAGDDPAGVLTYTVVGASTGLTQLWLLVLSTPMLVAATGMAARVALATGQGLAAVIERRYGRSVSLLVVLLLAIPNIATIAADAAGVASALAMLSGWPWEVFVPLILLLLGLLLRRGFKQTQRVLTVFTLALLTYLVAALLARPEWGEVLRATLTPQVELEKAWLLAGLGLLGTTISPYMLFWQATEELEADTAHAAVHAAHGNLTIWIGMIFSNVVAFAIVVAAATTIHAGGDGIHSVADAARALQPLHRVGDIAFIVGIVAAGLLALPVLAASTAYAVAEVFGWREGLDAEVGTARAFYLVLGLALVGGALISLLPDFHPAAALFYSQVLDGVLLPAILAILLVLSNDRRVVGSSRNPRWMNVVAVLTILMALAADFAALVS